MTMTTKENIQLKSHSSSFLCSSSPSPDLLFIAFWSHCSNLHLVVLESLPQKMEEALVPPPLLTDFILVTKFWKTVLRWNEMLKSKSCHNIYFLSSRLSSFIFNVNFGRCCAADCRPYLTDDRSVHTRPPSQTLAEQISSYIIDWLITRSFINENIL